jgi:BASS family bile acid:Na+ symporter
MLAAKFLPLGLAFIMFGLGLGLTLDDFRRILRVPKPVIIGLSLQLFLLPALAFAICAIFGLTAEASIGMMILAASPGGVTANVFSHLARGDVALNITLTALNSVIAAVFLPLVVGLSIAHFAGTEAGLGLQLGKALEVFAIVLIPVAIGMAVKQSRPVFAAKMDRPLRIFAAVFLVVLVIAAIFQEREAISASFLQIGGAVLTFNLVSLAVGYFVPLLVVRLPRAQAIAIAFEIGLHNSTLAIFIALSVLNTYAYAMPAAIYSIVMFATAGALVFIFKRNRV